MECYRCKSDQNLSPKKTDRHGNITFICKECRRAEYRQRRYASVKKPRDWTEPFNPKEWARLAKESHQRLNEKYRDEAFMKARGLI